MARWKSEQSSSGGRWRSYEEPRDDFSTGVESFFSGAGDAISFGFGDELLGFARGGLDEEARNRYTEESRQQQDMARSANPWAYGAGQVGGSLVGGGGIGLGARAGLGALRLANLGKNVGLLGRVGIAGVGGAVGGGVYGAGAETGENRVSGALEGAMWGAPLGVANQGAGELLGHVGRAAMRSVNPDVRAANMIGKMQERFGQEPAQLATALNKAPKGAMVMDVVEGGPQIVMGAGGRISAEKKALRDSLDARNRGMVDDAITDLWKTFGKGRGKDWDAYKNIVDLGEAKAKQAAPLYAKVEQTTIPKPDPAALKFVELHSRPGARYSPAMQRTVAALTNSPDTASPQAMRALMGTGLFWKRLMEETNDEWFKLKGAQRMTPLGAPGGTEWMELSQQRDELAKILRQKNMLGDDFAKAQDIWSGGSRAQEATRLGYNSVKAEGDLNVGEVMRDLKRMTPGEREQAQFAAVAALADDLQKTPDLAGRADALRRIIGSESKRITLNHLFEGRTLTKSRSQNGRKTRISAKSDIARLMTRLEDQHRLFQNSVDSGIGVNSHTGDKLLAYKSQIEQTNPSGGSIKDQLWKLVTGHAADQYDEAVSNRVLALMGRPVKEVKADIKRAGGLENWMKQANLLAKAQKEQQALATFRPRALIDAAAIGGLYGPIGTDTAETVVY